ncbi:hypothetical protein L1987_27171 [Smallanthus sonchifolius]|uniref:Uncharacterized protein n=1 Tax=Smallanthus sonchifolius TaxID=185202 RepID=A0ACB9IAT2_9ASTR|nr:hypothetical protein L1987_27171 [Smallanthus sonchifolius]
MLPFHTWELGSRHPRLKQLPYHRMIFGYEHLLELERCFNRTRLLSSVRILYSCIIMSDEEPVDQKKYFEELCKPKCVRAWLDYQGCVKRVQADKHCTGQCFDYWQCVDKCVAPRLFAKLK